MRTMLATLLLALAAGDALAFPDKPIRIVVPFAAGGGADSLARAVGDGMSKHLNTPVLIENKPGGDATIGGTYVAKSAPDGYTLLFASNTGFSGAPYLMKEMPYDPVRDFTPISTFGVFAYFVSVNRDLPVKTMQELIEYARQNPGKVNYATGNAMGIIATGQLASTHRLEMTHVPYKGEAPAMPDLLSNRVQMIFTTGFIVPHVKDGRVRALAAVNDERIGALPDVPTIAEAGFPEIAVRGWAGLAGPAGLPPEVANKLSAAVNAALRMPTVQAQLAQHGFIGTGSTPAEMAQVVRDQLRLWGQAVKAAGIKPN